MNAPADSPAVAHRVGLVDVGSNAVRTRVVEVAGARRQTLHEERTAIRVGREVFVSGTLTAATIQAVGEAMARFKSVCDRLGVRAVRAVATSAARTARNGDELVRVARVAGVELQIIDGAREANLLRSAIALRVDVSRGCNVLVDLGAGSLEVVVLDAGQTRSSGSFPLGSLRLSDALPAAARTQLGPPLLAAIDQLLADRTGPTANQLRDVRADRLLAVGSGIDLMADLEASTGAALVQDGLEAVATSALEEWRQRLAALDAPERTRQFGLTPDRADLVVVALSVFVWLARKLGVDAILVPRVSLRDGLLAEWLGEQTTIA